jgi:hypothetical protein
MISISSKNSIKSLIIPTSAIISKYWTPWVFIYKNKKATLKLIKALESDSLFTAISGLEKWEKIITDWKDNILDWEILE